MTAIAGRIWHGAIRPALLPGILIATLCLAPLPLGSTNPIAIAVWVLLLGLALIVGDFRRLHRRCDRAFITAVALIAIAYAFVVREQLSSAPLLGAMHPIWEQAGSALQAALVPSVEVVRNQAWYGLGSTLLCLLALVTGYVAGCDRRTAFGILRAIMLSGGVYAVIAILSFAIDPSIVLGYEKVAHKANLTTPFLNRNIAAIYFGACAIVAVTILLDRQERPESWFGIIRAFFSGEGRFGLPDRKETEALAAAACCFVALLLTSSRAGVVLALGGLVLACALFRRQRGAGGRFALFLLGGGAVALLLLQTVGSGVADRFEQFGLTDTGRFDTYRASISMIASSPGFGTGLGTFTNAFPPFRPPEASMWGVWDRAHNTLLEIATDAGLPLALLVLVAWLGALGVLIRGVLRRRRDRVYPVAALAVAVAALAHSMVDFPLQIPGVAIVTMALTGVGLAQSFSFERAINVDG